MAEFTYPAGKITANGIVVPISVDDGGNWRARYQDRNLSFETRDKLEAAIKRATRKTTANVEIPILRVQVSHVGDVTTRRGVLTGIHAGTGNPLVMWTVRGQQMREQITSWSESGVTYFPGDFPDEEVTRYARLNREKIVAVDALLRFEQKNKINPRDVLAEALELAVSEG